ncbi:uncharacterized protein A4U43_C02F190 [Asparagus officinalis]|uniref:Hs1pro-1 C-terminal domain-containing protein n=1 Tax=Asparagus officinalis TaxID=4686 RepID=A0A5P1FFD7_ASPOF|nr:uncharacterized protein A4U43_C02F190 [Asparagus officinalis]
MGTGGGIDFSCRAVDFLRQMFMDPPYFPSMDAAKTFLGEMWRCQTRTSSSFNGLDNSRCGRPLWFPREGEQHEDGDPGYHRGRNSDGEGGAHGEEAEDAAVEDGGVEGRPTGGEVGAGA